MFEINLLDGYDASKPVGTDAMQHPRLSRPHLPAIGLMVLVSTAIGWIGLHHVRAHSISQKWEVRRAVAESEAFTLARQLESQEGLEAARDSLITRLDLLQSLDESRAFWPDLWFTLASALPDGAWMVRFEQVAPPPGVRLILQGQAWGYGYVTSFMEQLAERHRVRLLRVDGVEGQAAEHGPRDIVHQFDIELEGGLR